MRVRECVHVWWVVVGGALCRCRCWGGRAAAPPPPPGGRSGRSLTQCAIRVKDRLFREKIDGFSVRFYRGGESTSFEILVPHHLCAEWWQWCICEARPRLTFSFSAFSLPMRSFALTGELGEAGSVDLGVLALILRCSFPWPLRFGLFFVLPGGDPQPDDDGGVSHKYVCWVAGAE